jgi:hypothetical protein
MLITLNLTVTRDSEECNLVPFKQALMLSLMPQGSQLLPPSKRGRLSKTMGTRWALDFNVYCMGILNLNPRTIELVTGLLG